MATVTVITSGSAGIGAATARLLVARGGQIVLAAREPAMLNAQIPMAWRRS